VQHGEPEAGLTARAGHRPGPEGARRVGGAWILTPAWHRHRGRRGGLCQRPAAGESVVQVVRGENLTELQALQAMLSPLRQQYRLPAGPLGGGLARGVRGQDERPGRLARAAQHAARRRQRRWPGHGEHGGWPMPRPRSVASWPGPRCTCAPTVTGTCLRLVL